MNRAKILSDARQRVLRHRDRTHGRHAAEIPAKAEERRTDSQRKATQYPTAKDLKIPNWVYRTTPEKLVERLKAVQTKFLPTPTCLS